MRAFLSYKFGDDISIIQNLLRSKNIEVFDSLSDVQYGDSFQQAIRDAVKECDFVIFIYSGDNPYIAFETGLAVAMGKPVFSILAGGEENMFLLDSTYVHAHPGESDKIKFSLDLFLKKIKPEKKPEISRTFYGGGEAVPMQSYFDVEARYKSIRGRSEIQLEEFFQEIFQAYNVNFAKSSGQDSKRQIWSADFSIWSDELSFMLGNPIVIEIRSKISPLNIDKLIQNLDKLHSVSINSAIVLYEHLDNIKPENLPNTPNRLFISIPELVTELKSKGFASSVKRIRNSIMHST